MIRASYEEIIDRFVAWAWEREDLRAAIVIGSRAREYRPADNFSDLDLVLVTTDPDRYLTQSGWLDLLGTPWLTFVEEAAVGGGLERRALFEGALEVDFAVLPYDGIRRMALGGWRTDIAGVLARGYRFILDKDGLSHLLDDEDLMPHAIRQPTPDEFLDLCNDFLYHGVWTAKKLLRGELWVAKASLDVHMKQQILQMLEWHVRSKNVRSYDTWHNGRFLESSWADPRAIEDLQSAFAHYNEADIRRALFASMDLFRWVAWETAVRLGYPVPKEADELVSAWISANLTG